MALVLKNYQLKNLCDWLNEKQLERDLTRARSRFFNLCMERNKEIADLVREVARKYADKDENGKIIMTKEKAFSFSEENTEKLNNDETLGKFFAEEFTLDVLAERKSTLHQIYRILMETEEVFMDRPGKLLATWYDGWCEAFEKAGLDEYPDEDFDD